MISLAKYRREWYRLFIFLLPFPAACIASFGHFRAFVLTPSFAGGEYLSLYLYTAILWPIVARQYRLASVEQFRNEFTGLVSPLKAVAVLFLLMSGIIMLTKARDLSRAYFLLEMALLCLLTVAIRAGVRTVIEVHHRTRRKTSILVVGADAYAGRVKRKLRRTPLSSFETFAFLRVPGKPIEVQGRPVYEFENLSDIDPSSFEEIIVAVLPQDFGEVSQILPALQEFSKPIHAVLDFGTHISVREKVFNLGSLQVVDLCIAPTESFSYVVLKRIFDVTFSVLALVLLSPIMLVAAVLVRISSPGPIFFRQERVGLNGDTFQMLKFRTMKVASSAQSDVTWTTQQDPRRTAIGALLRKTSLDELPQIFNVLKGNMSLVGPRPERPFFVSKFRREMGRYNVRHNVKVGITGWAQVNGLRGDTSIPRRLRYDLYYMQNWSLLFDLQIIFRTFLALWKRENAY